MKHQQRSTDEAEEETGRVPFPVGTAIHIPKGDETVVYKSHPVFAAPEDLGNKVWRYLDFSKFVFMLQTGSLYFTRIDCFDDPFEGSWPRKYVDSMNEFYRSAGVVRTLETKERGVWSIARRKQMLASCWHLSDYESEAMWRLYLKTGEGIAIQSTFERLRDSLSCDERVYIGKVKYIDYETDLFDDNNPMAAAMHKRRSFEHEREVRALIYQSHNADGTPRRFDHGLRVCVDLKVLIEKVFIAPVCPPWIKELVEGVIARYGYGFHVEQSSLGAPPFM